MHIEETTKLIQKLDKGKKESIPFKIKFVSPDEFELYLELTTSGKFFDTIYSQSLKRLSKEQRNQIEERELNYIDLPQEKLKLIKSGVVEFVNNVRKQTKAKGIDFARWDIDSCTMRKYHATTDKGRDVWYIKIFIRGVWFRK